jgi:hypothetical protein
LRQQWRKPAKPCFPKGLDGETKGEEQGLKFFSPNNRGNTMNKKLKSIFALAALCIFLGACASPAPNGAPSFSLVSNQKDRMDEFYVSMGKPIETKDCNTQVLFFIYWGTQGHSDEAVLAKALENNKADALMDTKFTHSSFFIPLLYSNSCTSVTGIPFKLKEQL